MHPVSGFREKFVTLQLSTFATQSHALRTQLGPRLRSEKGLPGKSTIIEFQQVDLSSYFYGAAYNNGNELQNQVTCSSLGNRAKLREFMDNKTRGDLAAVPTGIETEHLSRTVLDRALVSDISVQVRRGEILAVVGPSGAGKSSFLRLLNRLDEPTRGTVRLNGQDYREFPAHRPRGVVANERMCRERCSTVSGWSDCRFSCGARIPVCQGALRSNKAPNLLRQGIVQLQQRLVSQLVVAHALASRPRPASISVPCTRNSAFQRAKSPRCNAKAV